MRRKKIRFKNPYKLESELCEVFIKYARLCGWKAYPETSAWDILLVKDIQIGVQAKLKDNIDVLYQALRTGPNVRAVLVPRASREFKKIAKELGLFVIEGLTYKRNKIGNKIWLKEIKTDLNKCDKKFIIESKKLCWIPDIEINVPAGVKSPRSITKWKICAVKLCLKLNTNGFLTSTDFKEAGISIVTWKINKWLIAAGKIGKKTKYIRNKNIELPDDKYPEIIAALRKLK